MIPSHKGKRLKRIIGIHEGFILFPMTGLSQAPSVFEVKKLPLLQPLLIAVVQ